MKPTKRKNMEPAHFGQWTNDSIWKVSEVRFPHVRHRAYGLGTRTNGIRNDGPLSSGKLTVRKKKFPGLKKKRLFCSRRP